MSDPQFTPFDDSGASETAGFQPWSVDTPTTAAAIDEFARGLEEGQAAAQAAFAAERSAFQALLASAEALQPLDLAPVEQFLLEQVERLVREIVGHAAVDRDWLQSRARNLIEMTAHAIAPTLVVHPDDRLLLDGAGIAVPIAIDASLPRGTLRLDVGDGAMEHGRGPALAALHDALTSGQGAS